MEWCKLELPICLKKILIFCAYESVDSLRMLDKEKIAEVESHISEFGRCLLDELDCCHNERYKNQTTFKFLPGHRSILLSLSNYAQKIYEERINQNVSQLSEQNNEHSKCSYSVILTELLKTAQNNAKKSKNQASYSDLIRYFCTFIYLTSGRACYEILYRNLPIPSTKTICKCVYKWN